MFRYPKNSKKTQKLFHLCSFAGQKESDDHAHKDHQHDQEDKSDTDHHDASTPEVQQSVQDGNNGRKRGKLSHFISC